MRLEVECYSGRKADERPVRFRLDGHEYLVEEVLDQWYGPSDTYFKVQADDGNLYILRRETAAPGGHGIWNRSGNCHGGNLRQLALTALAGAPVAGLESSRRKTGFEPELQRKVMPRFVGEIRPQFFRVPLSEDTLV